MGLFSGIKKGLKKTREAFGNLISSIFSGSLDDEFYEELETALICADVGAGLSAEITERLRQEVKQDKLKEPDDVKQKLKDILFEILDSDDEFEIKTPAVITIVGVNGVGKTTSIGKLANYFVSKKKSVTIAAADTFRAAASDQLSVWADRAGVRIVKQGEGSDPAAVVFDAVASAKNRKTDILIIDTAGRLHNKVNLMEELKKIDRVVRREYEQANIYNFIVLDANTGQNAINQVNAFNESVNLDGIILTKLDGTSKGGVVIAINYNSDIPVRFIGVGEKMEDLEEFNAKEFCNELF